MLSVIVPVYRNEESVPMLLEALGQIHAGAGGIEAVLVVDGSPDHSYERLRELLPAQPYASRLAVLSRNFGSFAAIRTGLGLATGDRFAVMAADLQEPPELVLEMDQRLRKGDADVVLGVREDRNDPFFSRISANVFWAIYRRFVVADMPSGGVDIFACNRAFRDQLLQLDERHSSLIAQVFWLGFRRAYVPYVRRKRLHGRSAWTLSKKVEYLMDSVFSFTDLPMRLLVRLGGLVAVLSGVFGVLVAIARLSGFIAVPGYAALVVLVTFFGALNLFCLGLVGSYAWRTYENTKARPLHIVMECQEFPGTEPPKSS